MTTLAERLKFARNQAKLSQSKIADIVGISQPTYQALESGKVQKTSYMMEIASALKVAPQWLATGQGEMINETQCNHNNIQTMAKNNIRLAPVVNTIQADNFTNIGDDVFDDYSSYFGDYGDDAVYWLRISGNSMLPDFQDGEFVLINTDRQAVVGNYVVAIKDGETKAIFAKYRPKGDDNNGVVYFHLIPSNDDFPIIDSRFEPLTILGVAVERNQKLV